MLFVQQINQIVMKYLENLFYLNNILVHINSLIKTCTKSKHSFLGMILINYQEMDFIELLKRSFSRSERSGLAHFPIITIDIIQ